LVVVVVEKRGKTVTTRYSVDKQGECTLLVRMKREDSRTCQQRSHSELRGGKSKGVARLRQRRLRNEHSKASRVKPMQEKKKGGKPKNIKTGQKCGTRRRGYPGEKGSSVKKRVEYLKLNGGALMAPSGKKNSKSHHKSDARGVRGNRRNLQR